MRNKFIEEFFIGFILVSREKRILGREGRRFKPVERGWNNRKFFKNFFQDSVDFDNSFSLLWKERGEIFDVGFQSGRLTHLLVREVIFPCGLEWDEPHLITEV